MDSKNPMINYREWVEQDTAPSYLFSAVLFLIAYWALYYPSTRLRVSNAQVYGFRTFLEPALLLQARFVSYGHQILEEGYKKFKDRPFVVRRFDVDISVLPMKYLQEIRLISQSKLNARHAHIHNLVPDYTQMGFMAEGDLHFRVVANKLTSELPKYLEAAREELDSVWESIAPQADDWTEVDIQDVTRSMVSCISARIFLGPSVCKNQEWLRISFDFSIDLFFTAFAMRMFPPWAHPLVARFVPSRYRLLRYLKRAQAIIEPIIKDHDEAVRRRQMGESVEEDDMLFHWMLDNATEKEKQLPEMSNRQLMLSLASIHTTSMSVANIIFSLCDHPEHLKDLWDEIDEVKGDLGRLGTRSSVETRQWLARLEKLDSYFIECLRVHPVALLMPQREAIEPVTLDDGTHIPVGTGIAFANYQHQMDPTIIPDPDVFDPWRSYRKRRAAGQTHKHLAVQLNPDINTFGFGSQACPGRYFAVPEIKMITARLLNEYEFKYPEGKGRPKLIHADENIFLDPKARLMVRKRRTR